MRAPKAPQYKIGVWGPPSAGKTVYLWVYTYLIEHLRQLKDREWHIETDDATHKALGQLRSRILNRDRNLPDSTSEEKEYRFVVSGYSSFWLGRLQASVMFTDWPGEHLREDDRDAGFYKELATCHAILCFIDPLLDPRRVFRLNTDETPEDSEQWGFYQRKLEVLFRNLIEPEQEERYVRQIMAFLVTKVDHNQRWWDLRHRGEELLREIILDAGMTMIENHCKTYRIFPCSSIGAVLSPTGIYKRSNLEEDRSAGDSVPRYRLQDITNFERKPFGVVEPMTWILEQLKWRELWKK